MPRAASLRYRRKVFTPNSKRARLAATRWRAADRCHVPGPTPTETASIPAAKDDLKSKIPGLAASPTIEGLSMAQKLMLIGGVVAVCVLFLRSRSGNSSNGTGTGTGMFKEKSMA